jgi:hypothetical protein
VYRIREKGKGKREKGKKVEGVLFGTIAASIASYTGAEWLRFRGGATRQGTARALWTLAAVLCLVHAAAAFHWRHHWSHAAAYEDTAAQTAALTGLEWGGGLWINYLFLVLWIADAGWWWWSPRSYRSSGSLLTSVVTGFFLFMFLNGAVIFADGMMQILGIAAVLVVAWAWYKNRLKAAGSRAVGVIRPDVR